MKMTLLQYGKATAFPILAVMKGYAIAGEAFEVVALVEGENPNVCKNIELFQVEFDALCQEKGLVCPKGLITVEVGRSQGVISQLETFYALLDYLSEGDQLYGCLTYGAKPQTMALKMALQYAYRIYPSTDIDCVVYGQVEWDANRTARIYDETAMFQMDEIITKLSIQGVKDPRKLVGQLLRS